MSAAPPVAVSADEVAALARTLIRIPSQYIENELVQHREIAEFLAAHMTSIGLEVRTLEEVPSYPLVVGTTPGDAKGPTIGVVGHYSTVAIGDRREWTHDPTGAEVVEDRLYGRGAADQKGGIAAVLSAAKALMASGRPRRGRLRLLMVPGEGCTEMAVEPIVAKTPDAVRCDVYLDSDGGPGNITLVHGGWIWIELTTRGKGGHSGALTSDGTVPINPVAKMVGVLERLRNPDWMRSERHPLFGPEYGRHSVDPIVDVNIIRAGSKVNIIPNEATAQIDIRMLPAQTIPGVLAELDAELDRLRAVDPDLDVSYTILNRSKNPHVTSPDHPMIKLIQETCREAGESAPRLVGSIGGGRAAFSTFGPVMHFGACGGKGAHAPDEYTTIDRLHRGAQLHARLYLKALA
jgi:succinyl-diaminopimelate desuccinylase